MTRLLFSLLPIVLLFACSTDVAPLVATEISIKAPMPGMQMSAGYLTLTNNTAEEITITEVTSAEFASIQMHETVIEDDVAKMRQLEAVVVPAGASVEFKPGGKHLMLMRPTASTESVSLQFIADNAVVLSISAPLVK